SAFLQIAPDGAVTLWASRSEMGQGVRTSLPMILAEEIGADWGKVKIEQAWNDPRFGELDTGGSDSTRSMYEPLRKAGATARAMLTAAAAARLNVPAAGLQTANGLVIHAPTGRKLPFSDLVAAAAALPAPTDPPLKDPKTYTIVGRAMPRTDSIAKVDGKAIYGIDVVLPGMLYAAVVLPPTFGAVPDAFDEASAKKIPGVKGVVRFRRGFAVLADSTWAAFKGRDALVARFRETETRKESSAAIRQRAEAVLAGDGLVLRADGNLATAMASAARRIEATYEIPFQAHAAMEPTNATAEVKDGRCTIWAPAQTPSWARTELQTLLGLPAEAIRINITFLGGGFGRRINPDFILDVAEIAKAAGAPVKMTWSREQDLTHDYYRPWALHKMAAAIDPEGRPTAWRHRFASTSISLFYDPATKQPESDELGGAADLPHAIPNVMVTYSPIDTPVPRGWWRSVDSSGNAFVVESFLDEIAALVGKDPLLLRQDLLREPRTIKYPGPWVQETARLKAVLDLAAQKASWEAPLPAGQGRGVAAHFSFRSYCAMVAEVESDGRSFVKVNRIVAAVDCGRVINPGLVAAQMESAVIFALSAAMKGSITVSDGRVVEQNFNTFELMRIDEAPKVETYIVPSIAPPTGVGEPGVPVVAPAVFNAVYAATKKRIRKLPFTIGAFASA
ncbi:MAG TPA: molybdopterin cofactor-binding domain-containing protein, partial [Dongiaceae bacterium]|nr:molybdopterin cofactor-binding domain-containing protein [Dongiaceae bacterium]